MIRGNGIVPRRRPGAGCPARGRESNMSPMTPAASRRSPCSCVFVDAHAFSYPWFAGIARYTARLALALSRRVPVRFFDGAEELLPPPGLAWLQDQDLEDWGRRIWGARRRPLGTP